MRRIVDDVWNLASGHLLTQDSVFSWCPKDRGKIISPPNSGRIFLFASVEHYDLHNYEGAGDKAIASMGLLFEIRGEGLSLLVSERSLTRVFSISDVDNDGVWEVLAHSGDWGGGTYEVRFFDGSQFTKDKLELYEWSH